MISKFKPASIEFPVPGHHHRLYYPLSQLFSPLRQRLAHVFEFLHTGSERAEHQKKGFRIGRPALFRHIDIRRLDPVELGELQ